MITFLDNSLKEFLGPEESLPTYVEGFLQELLETSVNDFNKNIPERIAIKILAKNSGHTFQQNLKGIFRDISEEIVKEKSIRSLGLERVLKIL